MGTRNFEFMVAPEGGQRGGRYTSASAVQIGAPVAVGAAAADDTQAVTLVATPTDVTKNGEQGILVYEPLFVDGPAYSPSDVVKCPAGAMVQVVHGDEVKVRLTNTDAVTMVAGLGDTPTVAVGDYLTPSAGGDNSGYWEETQTPSEAWLTVTYVDGPAGVVEAVMTF